MTRSSFAALAAITALAGVVGCVDPVLPFTGAPTLDDPGFGAVAAVAVGGEHSCAITSVGDAYCWGSNEFGQAGAAIGDTTCARVDRNIPCKVSPRLVGGGFKFQRIAAGSTHTCGLLQDARIFCWGDNSSGQLGDPATAFAVAPQPVQTASLFTDVVAGYTHTCGLRTDGVALCWGSNDMGQLGISSGGIGSAIPVTVQTAQRFASLSAGASRTCGRTSAGSPFCWGAHWVARAFNGTEITRAQSQPGLIQPSPAMRQVSVGGQSTCGLAMDGSALCWEANPTGSIGDGSLAGSTSPRPVSSNLHFTQIAAGAVASCAVAEAGETYCWGSGDFGQLGVSTATLAERCSKRQPCALSPNRASGWRVYSWIAAGPGEHMCGLTMAGSVYCWGWGSMGQRGDGTLGSSWSPTRVPLP